MMLAIYGIKNCNTVKKALTWLGENQIDYRFHDFKKEGISEEKLQEWEKHIEWEKLVNRKGTTWKKLDPATQSQVVDAKTANKILQEHTSIIKRPVIELKDGLILGFNEAEYAEKLK